MNSTMRILSVRQVSGPMRPDGGTFEIKAEVDNGFLKEEVTWSYSPEYNGHEERLDTDCAMNNPMGYLLLGLLREVAKGLDNLVLITGRKEPQVLTDINESCDEMEGLLG
jgi:hypothetical protein